MEQYTIYCTEEQTRKALELGAPIEPQTSSTLIDTPCAFCDDGMYIIPTAEQMIGWLEEQGVIIDTFKVTSSLDGMMWYGFRLSFPWQKEKYSEIKYDSRKEATLAAVDAALEYLENNLIK